MGNIPDQVPTLAVLALFAENKTRITNVEHLEYKESSRLTILNRELKKIGAVVRIGKSFIEIEPLRKIPKNIILDPENDHRLAMAFHLIQSQFSHLKIINLDCINKSFPEFLRIWHILQITNHK